MNKAQRKQLNDLSAQIGVASNELRRLVEDFTPGSNVPGDAMVKAHVAALKTALEGADVTGSLEEVRDEEESKYDNMPESLQNGANGERIQAAIDALQTAVDNLESAVDELNTGINDVEQATTASDLADNHAALEGLIDALEEVTDAIGEAVGA